MSLQRLLATLILFLLMLRASPLWATQTTPQPPSPQQKESSGAATPAKSTKRSTTSPAKRTATKRTSSTKAKSTAQKSPAPAGSAAAPAVSATAAAQQANENEAAVPPVAEQPKPDTPRAAVVELANSLLDTRYHYGGTTPQSGFDCSGLVGYVYREGAGVTLPRSSAAMARAGEKVELDALQPGDLLLFARPQKAVSHVGIYIGEGRFIHAATKANRVKVSDMEKHYLREELVGARRYLP